MSLIKRQIEIEDPELFRGNGQKERLSEDDMNSEADQQMFFDRVEEEMEAIIREEGTVTVRNIYIANQYDCATARQFEAERRVREKARAREILRRTA